MIVFVLQQAILGIYADMIDIIAKYDNIMPSIHLPVQSGNDEVLKLMGRRYSKGKLFEAI